jgi:hypothetical protein
LDGGCAFHALLKRDYTFFKLRRKADVIDDSPQIDLIKHPELVEGCDFAKPASFDRLRMLIVLHGTIVYVL